MAATELGERCEYFTTYMLLCFDKGCGKELAFADNVIVRDHVHGKHWWAQIRVHQQNLEGAFGPDHGLLTVSTETYP